MSTSIRSRHPWWVRLGPWILAVGPPLVAYLLTLYLGVGDRQGTGDAIEYQFVGKILAIPHEPGYPQYVLLSHLWTYLPFPGSLATQINLLSAAFTVTAGAFFFSAARQLSGNVTAAVLSTWMVLLTPSVWLLSTQAEVYSLHLMWVAAVLWAALGWSRSKQQRYLIALFFFYALSFGNHLTMITLLPGLVFLVLTTDPRITLRWQNWMWATLAIAAGLLQYGLLLWRSYHPHPALLPRFPLNASPGELLDYITGSRFVDRHFLKEGVAGWLPNSWEAATYSIHQLTIPFTALCIIGFFIGMRRWRLQTLFLTLAAGCVVAFAAAYGIKDSLLYTMPAWFCAGLLAAMGLDTTFQRLGSHRSKVVLALGIAIAVLTAWRGSHLRVRENTTDLQSVMAVAEPGTGVLAAFKPRRARLLRLYYRYGEVTEKALELDFLSVNEVLATGLENAGDRPMYFRDPRTARVLRESFIDYGRVRTDLSGYPIFTSIGADPLHSVTLRPLWNGALALSIRDRSLDLLGESTIHLLLLSAQQHRSKGYLTFDTQENQSWSQQLQEALDVATPSDRVLLVIPDLGIETWNQLATLLGPLGVELPSPSPAERQTVIWWRVGGTREDTQLRSNLEDSWTLLLDVPPTP